MAELKLKTKGQKLIIDGKQAFISAGNRGFDTVRIKLDSEWQSEALSAYKIVVWRDDCDPEEKVIDRHEDILQAEFPDFLFENPGTVYVGIYGKDSTGNVLLTSSPVIINIAVGTPTNGAEIIDWQKAATEFKENIIAVLNDVLGTDLPENSDFQEIIDAIENYQNPEIGSWKQAVIEKLSSKWPDIPYEKYSFGDIVKILLIQSQPVAEGEKVIDYFAQLDENGEPVFDENGNPIIDIITARVVDELVYQESLELVEELRNEITQSQTDILNSLYTLYTGGNVNV